MVYCCTGTGALPRSDDLVLGFARRADHVSWGTSTDVAATYPEGE